MDSTDPERRRLKILRRLNILDSPPERMIDDIATIASQLLGTPMSAVTLIDESRQWFKALVGIDLVETPRSVAFCDHTIRSVAPFVVPDATIDARFENNPLVVGPPHIRSYAGVPLRVGGVQVGALCVIDTESREFSGPDISALQALGRLVVRMFELRWRRQLANPPSDAYVFDVAATIDTVEDFRRLLADQVRPAWLYDRSSLRFLAVNDSAVELYGWSRDQFLAMTLADVQPLDDAPAFRSRVAQERTEADETTGRSCRHVRADGTEARVHLSFALVKSATIDGELVVVTDLTARNQGRNALVHAATHDPLTGLPNRTEFHQQVSRMLEEHPARPLALLFVDLDGFKLVNDTAGHVAGDVLLAATADRLNRSLRDTDLLARMGGDEFAIACAGATLDDVMELARRIADNMKQPLLVNERQHFLTASIGIAVSDAESTCEGMLIEADLAMLAAKAAGRATVAVFDQKLRSTIAKRAAIEHDLHVAIARREFELYYQPIVGLNNNAVHFEALLRWNHPTRGVLAPAEFLSVAEEAGLIVPIGSWVLREAAACSVRLNRNHPGTRVAFNLATQQLTGALIAEVEAVLAETGAEPHHLIAEVTESGLTTKEAGLVTRRLQQMGLAISIDDFGTGYSSLGRLRELDVDALKLDRCFVNELGSRHGRRMMAAIIQLARAVDLPVVVEGVETTEQLTLLRELDCDYVQGYLFARPMPETHVADWFFRMFVGGFAGRTDG